MWSPQIKQEEENKVIFFSKEIIVEKSSADSAQSIVFFGRESTMFIRVVLKQYSGDSFKSIFKEIKIFTLLEVYKEQQNTNKSLFSIIMNSKKHDAMPELLGYKISNGIGEILMFHGGDCLETW